MKLHRNARTTPAARATLVQRVLHEQWTYAEVADGAGVSVRTVAKWVQRYRQGGMAALEDRSSRPGAPRHQTPAAVVTRIRRLRETKRWPAWRISRHLGCPRSTVSRWLQRLGLGRPARVAPPPARRYERATPGELLHVDIKPLGRFRQEGHRVHGDRQRHSKGIGWEYVHVAIDDHSRLSYVEVLPDQTGIQCAAFLDRAVGWFAARGVTCQRVMSDNGSGYVSRLFAEQCRTLALRHLRTRPYTPRTNGKAERFIQTLQRECAYVRPYRTSQARRRALQPWLRYYNQGRPHASLNYQPPITRLQCAA
jgi:transposase InsO family protein